MIRAEDIPGEVVDAADAAQRTYPDYDQRGSIRAAIAAAINVWPQMRCCGAETIDGDVYPPVIYLPLPHKENNDG